MKRVERWRENKVRESKVYVEKCVDFFTKKGNDSITMERTEMTKWQKVIGALTLFCGMEKWNPIAKLMSCICRRSRLKLLQSYKY